jgi:DNA polymerase III subunit gamma/tau
VACSRRGVRDCLSLLYDTIASMSTALYRRYRSAAFSDLIGQDHLATTLRQQVRDGKVPHAYLFAGMRGTGKTSTARILARAVNCPDVADGEPCNQCTSCTDITASATVDVLEIDAASNRGIDEMRDLREKVKFLPASLSRKVYIIDEAHMLTNEAWNALLKTLEEPPEHVLFILATTEPHKIPETVRSRVQRFDFRRVPADAIAAHLVAVGKQERLEVDTDAAALLAQASQGSVRDALSLLEQCAGGSDGRLTAALVRSGLGYADAALISRLITAVTSGDAATALVALDEAISAGAEPRQLLRDIGRVARTASLRAIGYTEKGAAEISADEVQPLVAQRPDVHWWLDALERIAQTDLALRQPVDARLQVEQCILQIACSTIEAHGAARTVGAALVPAEPQMAAQASAKTDGSASIEPQIAAQGATKTEGSASIEPQLTAHGAAHATGTVEEWNSAWPRLIEAVNKRKEISLAGVLRDCRPIDCSEDELTIGALYAFHLDRLKDPEKLSALTEAVAEVGGVPRKVTAVFTGKTDKASDSGNAEPDTDLRDAVLETFAGSRITSSRMKDRDRDNN